MKIARRFWIGKQAMVCCLGLLWLEVSVKNTQAATDLSEGNYSSSYKYTSSPGADFAVPSSYKYTSSPGADFAVLSNYSDGAAPSSRLEDGSTRSISRQIHYSFTIQNKTNRLLKKAEFWTYAPVRQTSRQRCLHLEASYPYRLIGTDLGNQILYFTFDNLAPFAAKVITIKAEVEFLETPAKISQEGTGRLFKRLEAASTIFLRAQEYVESDDPELSRFARKFKASEPAKTAGNIFSWVAENIKYTGYISDDLGALYALKNKQGDCTEFMYLFVALCRANTIAARPIGGYICDESSALKPNGYHNWAEFYENGVWKIADPQKKVFRPGQSYYMAMRVIGPQLKDSPDTFHRFRFSGDKLEVKMNE